MDFHIPDLLDGLTEVNIDIQPKPGASANRIKELTMKKIHPETKRRHRTLSAFSKILIAAAVLASLAIPVMAATGFHFSDWLEGMFSKSKDYDTDIMIGSQSKNWEHAGWVFNLQAEDAHPEGVTIYFEEWANGEHSGSLTTDESYLIERWNGEAYELLPEPAEPIPTGETIEIEAGSKNTWTVNWADTYGPLESGSYRLCKNFIYTNDAGQQETLLYHVKFRIFTEEMGPYIEACRAAVEEVRNRDSYHLTESNSVEGEEYVRYLVNQWKHGNDFLQEYRYEREDGSLVSHRGYLMRDGKGYQLTWNEDNVLSGVASWEKIDWLTKDHQNMWDFQLEIFDSNVGEVYEEENTTYLLSGTMNYAGDIEYDLQSFTMDAQGKLTFAQRLWLVNKDDRDSDNYCKVDIHDTTPNEIAKVIDAQAVDKPIAFNWVEEQAAHPAGNEGVKSDGFVNTTPQGTVTLENVVAIAQKECTLEWQNTAVVFYDETADMWKVELGFSQDSTVCQTVYLDNQGITRLVVE